MPGTPTQKWGDCYWGQDPEFAAKRGTGGSWIIIRHERGSVTEETIASDRDLVVLWLETFRNRFVLPWGVGYATEDQDAAELAPATLPVLEADIADARYPYRADWIAKRAAFFAALPSTSEETPAPAQGD